MSKETIEAPLFLVGSERSGSTMLGLMLGHHPKLAWLGQFEYATRYLDKNGGWPAIDDYCKRLEIDRIFGVAGLTIDRRLNYPQLMRSFLQQRLTQENKPLVGAAVHKDFHLLPSIWPRAKFIYLLRDGRDVSRSCIQMGWAGNMWTGAERWLEAETQWQMLCEIIDPTQRSEVRYEELVVESISTLTSICSFIGLRYDSRMMKYSETSTYSKPDAAFIYQWRRKLSDDEIRLSEARIGEQLQKRGYSKSKLAPLQMSAGQKTWLSVQDKIARTRYRIKRYGWELVIISAITRRLGLEWLHKPVRLKINSIDSNYLK